MSTATETKPVLGDLPTQWPPVAHIIKKLGRPPREDDTALCGAKLMGIDLERQHVDHVCEKCIEVFKKAQG